jgi:hypothetical protein
MNKNKEPLNFNKLPDKAMKLAFKKSYELIQGAVMTDIWPKLCTVEEITIPNAISEYTFDKLLTDIFNTFRQVDHAFSKKLKLTIEEFVLKTLEAMCNDAVNYILDKAKPIDELQSDTKVFKTKIIINKKIIQISATTITKFKTFQKQSIFLNKKHVLPYENKRTQHTKIKRSIGNNFGKIDRYINNEKDILNKIKLDYFIKWYTLADFQKMQVLNGAFNFIDTINQRIQKIPKDEWKDNDITQLKENVYEFTTHLGKPFYEFFAEFDDKKDKHGNFTQFQTQTTKKILKIFQEIQTLEFCMPTTKNKNFFIQPIHIKAIEVYKQKTFITLWIDTNILLLQNYNIEKMPFFVVMNKAEILKLKNLWYENLSIMKKSNFGKWTFFHDYRLNQFIDLVIKSHNIFQCNYYKGNPKYYNVPVNLLKNNWNNLVLPEQRLNEHLRRSMNYKNSSRRIDTIQTKEKIRDILNEHLFKILEKANYLGNPPKLIKNIFKFKLNPNNFNPTQAQNKTLFLKKGKSLKIICV